MPGDITDKTGNVPHQLAWTHQEDTSCDAPEGQGSALAPGSHLDLINKNPEKEPPPGIRALTTAKTAPAGGEGWARLSNTSSTGPTKLLGPHCCSQDAPPPSTDGAVQGEADS